MCILSLVPAGDEEDDLHYFHDADISGDYIPSEDGNDSTDEDDYICDKVAPVDGYSQFSLVLSAKHIRVTLELPYGFFKRFVCMGALQNHIYFNVDGTTWRVMLGHSSRKIWVQQGWRCFKEANALKAGIRCHFQLIDAREVIFYIWFDRDDVSDVDM